MLATVQPSSSSPFLRLFSSCPLPFHRSSPIFLLFTPPHSPAHHSTPQQQLLLFINLPPRSRSFSFFFISSHQPSSTTPTPKSSAGIPFPASVQAGSTPADLRAVPATNVTKTQCSATSSTLAAVDNARCACVPREASQSQPVGKWHYPCHQKNSSTRTATVDKPRWRCVPREEVYSST